jgi:hypothetical protein
MSTDLLPDWNAVRFDPSSSRGHVESYFVKANEPGGRRALWLKATIHAPTSRPSQAVAEAWAVAFDRDGHNVAVKHTVPYAQAAFSRDALGVRIGEVLRFEPGELEGSIEHGGHRIGFRLGVQGTDPPLVPFPHPAMYSAPFPKSKLVTPRPNATLRGTLSVDGDEVAVDDWVGMQGHNWGTGHADLYAWGQCNLWEREKHLVVEAVSARVRVGPVLAPMLTLVCVRWRGVPYEFTGPMELVRNRGEILANRWRFRARGAAGAVEGDLSARTTDFVGLYYANPDGAMTYCLNSKLALARLSLRPAGGEPVEAVSQCAALEIGTRDPGHGVRMYV